MSKRIRVLVMKLRGFPGILGVAAAAWPQSAGPPQTAMP
jgi:hypothetical protein